MESTRALHFMANSTGKCVYQNLVATCEELMRGGAQWIDDSGVVVLWCCGVDLKFLLKIMTSSAVI